jgi:type II restriction/modification system DNA methylase subunit YeeA
LPDDDGIVPVTDMAYFDDDISLRFEAFLQAAFGEDDVQENLDFVAAALGQKSESSRETIRRYFVNDFVKDHNRSYSKRPIYWLFTSGKQRAFGALVYMHRYTPDTLAQMRTKYVLPLQYKLTQKRDQLNKDLETLSGNAQRQAQKQLQTVNDQINELRVYHDVLQHKSDERISIDLDDGVAYNYSLFAGLVYEGADLKMADMEKRSQWKRDLLAAEQQAAGEP